jgi:hypothetical protein
LFSGGDIAARRIKSNSGSNQKTSTTDGHNSTRMGKGLSPARQFYPCPSVIANLRIGLHPRRFRFQSYAKVGFHRRQNLLCRTVEIYFAWKSLILLGDYHFLARRKQVGIAVAIGMTAPVGSFRRIEHKTKIRL